MKRILLTAAAVITVMSTALASGESIKETRAAIVPGKNFSYKVLYDMDEASVVRITIRDEKGKILRADKVKTEDGFMQRYKLHRLPAGTYYMQVTDKFGSITEKIELAGL